MSYLSEGEGPIPASSDLFPDFVLQIILLCLVGFLNQELGREGSICLLSCLFSGHSDLLWSVTPAFQAEGSVVSCRRLQLLASVAAGGCDDSD